MERENSEAHHHQQQSNNVQILDISNHLRTLIRIGYAGETDDPRVDRDLEDTRLASKKKRKRSNASPSSEAATMNDERRESMAWRRWRDNKMHWESGSSHSRGIFSTAHHHHDAEVLGTMRKRAFDVTNYGEQQAMNNNNHVRNRQFKHSMTSLHVVGSSSVYNNGMLVPRQTPPYYNDLSSITSSQQRKFNEAHSKFNVPDTFKDYCDKCTIHGLKYVGDTDLPHFERIFWVFSFILAIIGAAYFIWHLYSKFTLSPIIISRSSETVNLDQIPFPAITICNMNNAKKSVAEDILKGDDNLEKFFLDDICNTKANNTAQSYANISKKSGEFENVYNFLLKASQSCSDMLHYCEWNATAVNCTEIFNPVLTDDGLCCKFNVLPKVQHKERTWDKLDISYLSDKNINWTPEYKFTAKDLYSSIPWRAIGSGVSYGLTLALDVDADEYYCSSTNSVGFKMLLHSPVELPQIRDYAFTLSPGKETRVIITPHITEASPSIRKILPKIRQCYFLDEKRLRYFRVYTQRNCALECEANFTLKHCDCMQHYMPVEDEIRICGKTDDDCANSARKLVKTKLLDEEDKINVTLEDIPSCKCYPGCYEINYSTEISQSMLVNTLEIPEEYKQDKHASIEKDIAIVHIFFIDSSYMKYSKNELYGFAELLSNTGGLLGLFMGFSLLSVMEIFYYFTIRLWWRLYKRRQLKNNNKLMVQAFAKTNNSIYPFAQ